MVDVRTGAVRHGSNPPVLTSASGPWVGVLLEHHVSGGAREWNQMAPREHVLILGLGRPVTRCLLERECIRTVEFKPGQIIFHPAMIPFSFRSADVGEFLLLALDPTFVRRVAYDLLRPPDLLEWQPVVALEDAVISSIMMTLKEEVENGYLGGRSYGEMLAAAVVARLLSRWSTVHAPGPPAGERLSPLQLRRVTEHIQANLGQSIPLAKLAAVAGISPFHFARLFKQTTGCAPHQYLIRCRVERARQLLLDRPGNAADVALDVGFCDQSHLTMHFRRAFGVAPKEFQKAGAVCSS